MTRPLAYITAPWGEDHLENATLAASYCRQAYEAGYSPICPVLFMPTFLKGDAPAEVKDRKEMSDELLKRSRILIVCGNEVNDQALPNLLHHAQRRSGREQARLKGKLLMNELKDIPVFLWPTMLYPLDFCFRESGQNAETKPGRKEGCRMKKIFRVALPAVLIVLPTVMLIRKRRIA